MKQVNQMSINQANARTNELKNEIAYLTLLLSKKTREDVDINGLPNPPAFIEVELMDMRHKREKEKDVIEKTLSAHMNGVKLDFVIDDGTADTNG